METLLTWIEGGEEESSLTLFLKIEKKCLFWGNVVTTGIYGLISHLRCSSKSTWVKWNPAFFFVGPFVRLLLLKYLWKWYYSKKIPCPSKNPDCSPCLSPWLADKRSLLFRPAKTFSLSIISRTHSCLF